MIKPSLQSLMDRAKNTLISKLGVVNPAIDAMAAVVGGASYGQYTYQDYLFRQLSPETAEESWLYLWASRFRVERAAASRATGTVTFNLTSGVVSVPSGVIIQTPDGKEYQVTQTALSSGPVYVQSVDSGQEFNLPAGISLYLITAVPGLNPEEILSSDISGGADIEDLERWRERVTEAFYQVQAVGRLEDYELWAKAAHADVDFGWALGNTPQLGHVTVYIGQKQANPIVSVGVKAVVQDYINANRLAGCHVNIVDPTIKLLDVTLSGVDDITTRAEVAAALEAYIQSRMGDQAPITSGEIVIAITPITTSFSLTSPTTTTTLAANEIIVLGAITWI